MSVLIESNMETCSVVLEHCEPQYIAGYNRQAEVTATQVPAERRAVWSRQDAGGARTRHVRSRGGSPSRICGPCTHTAPTLLGLLPWSSGFLSSLTHLALARDGSFLLLSCGPWRSPLCRSPHFALHFFTPSTSHLPAHKLPFCCVVCLPAPTGP